MSDGLTGTNTYDCHWKSMDVLVGNQIICRVYIAHTPYLSLQNMSLTCNERVTLQSRSSLFPTVKIYVL
jgi:hypothetical protein